MEVLFYDEDTSIEAGINDFIKLKLIIRGGLI